MHGLFKQRTILAGTANNMTGTTAIHSNPMDWTTIRAGSIQAVWTGTPNGTFKVEGSLNHVPGAQGVPSQNGTWSDLGISMTAPAGVAGDAIVDIALTGVPWIRLTYTNSSSTGTLTVYGSGKGN